LTSVFRQATLRAAGLDRAVITSSAENALRFPFFSELVGLRRMTVQLMPGIWEAERESL